MSQKGQWDYRFGREEGVHIFNGVHLYLDIYLRGERDEE